MTSFSAFVAPAPVLSRAEKPKTRRRTPRACTSTNFSRRNALKLGALAAAGAAGSSLYLPSKPTFGAPEGAPAGKPLELPPLPYAYNALEPVIDRETMILHHDKHFAKYTEGTNAALGKIPGAMEQVNGNPAKLADLLSNLDSIEDASVRTALRNNGGGYLNHYQFFNTMTTPNFEQGKKGPLGDIGGALFVGFGSYPRFQEEFTRQAKALFGSGFVYLVRERYGKKLAIKSYPNQDTPVMFGDLPLLGLDLWEHAYYKKYSNQKSDYIAAWYNVINWEVVTKSYRAPTTPSA